MTTYILHGGNTSKASPDNDDFFRQFTHSVAQKQVNILICYWASTKDTWKEKYQEDKTSIGLYSKIHFNIQIATDPDDFKQKISTNHVVYFRGGRLHPQPYFSKLSSLKEMLDGKVYIGSSMGAYFVATNYMASSRNSTILDVKRGLGLLPLSIVCHWDIKNMERQKRVTMLQKHSPDLPILTIDEQKYVKLVY